MFLLLLLPFLLQFQWLLLMREGIQWKESLEIFTPFSFFLWMSLWFCACSYLLVFISVACIHRRWGRASVKGLSMWHGLKQVFYIISSADTKQVRMFRWWYSFIEMIFCRLSLFLFMIYIYKYMYTYITTYVWILLFS